MADEILGEIIKVSVIEEDAELRLDKYLMKRGFTPSRNIAQRLISDGHVKVNGKKVKKNYTVVLDDAITFLPEPPGELKATPEDLELDIVYEDSDIVVVSKAAGMVTHPAPGHPGGTLVNALLSHTTLANIGGPVRPGIVHRLDKETSGLLVAARTDKAYYALVEEIKNRVMKRCYLVLVEGTFKESSGDIKAAIGRSPHNRKIMSATSYHGRDATTHFKVVKRYDNATLLEATLDTGRTHQIRVHMRLINHKVIGDPVYGAFKKGESLGIERQFLHAYKLEFIHPTTGNKLKFTARLPDDLVGALKNIRKY